MRVVAVIAMQRRQYPRWNQRAFDERDRPLPRAAGTEGRRSCRAANAPASTSRWRWRRRPELLVLDEPTLGLDVVAKRAFLESLMYSNAADDCTVIYCSHQMEEIERVADNLIILERGR